MTMQSEDLVLFCTCKQQDILKYSSENWFLGVLNMLFYHFFLFTLNIALLELFYSNFFEPGADKKKILFEKKLHLRHKKCTKQQRGGKSHPQLSCEFPMNSCYSADTFLENNTFF